MSVDVTAAARRIAEWPAYMATDSTYRRDAELLAAAWLARRDDTERLRAETERLRKVLEAARIVDAFLSVNGPPFRFDRKRLSDEAEIGLLILHDEINGVDFAALEEAKPRAERTASANVSDPRLLSPERLAEITHATDHGLAGSADAEILLRHIEALSDRLAGLHAIAETAQKALEATAKAKIGPDGKTIPCWCSIPGRPPSPVPVGLPDAPKDGET